MEKLIEENLKRMSQCYNVILELTCEAIIENTKEGYHSELEPWETFEARTRTKMAKNTKLLEKRFSDGYTALMEELAGGEPVKVLRNPNTPAEE